MALKIVILDAGFSIISKKMLLRVVEDIQDFMFYAQIAILLQIRKFSRGFYR